MLVAWEWQEIGHSGVVAAAAVGVAVVGIVVVDGPGSAGKYCRFGWCSSC